MEENGTKENKFRNKGLNRLLLQTVMAVFKKKQPERNYGYIRVLELSFFSPVFFPLCLILVFEVLIVAFLI